MNRNADALAILGFWFGEGEKRGQPRKAWFGKDPAFDREIRKRFLPLYEEAASGGLQSWLFNPASALARIVLLDQFPRNMFRDSPRAFATDALALATAGHCLDQGWDRDMSPVERMFCYLPFEHSESIADQNRSCALMRELDSFPETPDVYRYALRHREIIERFGRFPHRNAALGRANTAGEETFLRTPGSGF